MSSDALFFTRDEHDDEQFLDGEYYCNYHKIFFD